MKNLFKENDKVRARRDNHIARQWYYGEVSDADERGIRIHELGDDENEIGFFYPFADWIIEHVTEEEYARIAALRALNE